MTSIIARKLFILGTSPPQGRFDFAAGVAFLLCLAFSIAGISVVFTGSESLVWIMLPGFIALLVGSLFGGLGIAFSAICKLGSNGSQYQSYLLKRLDEQDERIQKLEAQIAALTSLSSQR